MASEFQAMTFGNILFGGLIGVVVDAASGATHEYPPLVTITQGKIGYIFARDGARLETKGPWKVDGRRVVFQMPNGTLSSVRSDEVDLDRSAAETARAAEAWQ